MQFLTSSVILLLVVCSLIEGKKTILSADGNSGGTYALINTVLRGDPKKSAVEPPDCLHPGFGPHIRQVQDASLKAPVFAFYLHLSPDGDTCARKDRQRNEIATNSGSPKDLKGFQGETVVLSWDFQLPSGFQASEKFTHVHQIKSGDGSPGNGSPLITLSPGRDKKTGKQSFEVIHFDSQKKMSHLKKVDLSPFVGHWVHALERITYGSRGKYEILIKTVKGQKEVLSYKNDNLDLWRPESTFFRPKWGIYRSLEDSKNLRDERVLFNNFCFSKIGDTDLCK